jgi:hypothetical protein
MTRFFLSDNSQNLLQDENSFELRLNGQPGAAVPTMSDTNIKVKGSGQECPLYMGDSILSFRPKGGTCFSPPQAKTPKIAKSLKSCQAPPKHVFPLTPCIQRQNKSQNLATLPISD